MKRTILVVHSNPRERVALIKVLSKMGCLVQSAASGREGLKVIEHDAPAAVLFDPHIEDVPVHGFKDVLRQHNPAATLVLTKPTAESGLPYIRPPYSETKIRRILGPCDIQ